MNYCFNYYRKSRNIDKAEVGEINIVYGAQDASLITFLKTYPNKRVNLIIKDIDVFIANQTYNKLNAIKEEIPDANFAVCFGYLNNGGEALKRAVSAFAHLENIPYYAGTIATDWDTLHHLLLKGVCDVYIGEQLGFELDKVSTQCKKYNVRVRAFSNVAQNAIADSDSYLKFFIRPNDLQLYSQYIDTLEFWGPDDRQDVLFEIYQKGIWMGNLNEIILGFNAPIDNKCIAPLFGETRINCGKKCLKGAHCRMCYTIANLADTLKDKRLIFKQQKND